MSLSHKEEITCPNCGHKGEFDVWESINTDLDPEMFEKVRNGEAFKYTCPKCDDWVNVDYGFLYHQMIDKIMIQYCNSDENEKKALEFIKKRFDGADKDIDKLLNEAKKGYLNRIVRSKNQFREKLFVFDSGLDDRVIEIIKVFYLSQISNEKPELNADYCLFYVDDDRNNNVQFFSGGNPVASGPIDDEMYNMIKKEYVDELPDIREDDVVIDFNWAMNRISDSNNK